MRTIIFTAITDDDMVIVYYDEKFITDSYDDLFDGINHLASIYDSKFDYVEIEIRY